MFKKGDEIRCIKSCFDENEDKFRFTRGRTYVVLQYFPGKGALDPWVSVEKDDQCDVNGWCAEYFKLVNKPKENKMSKPEVRYLLTRDAISLQYGSVSKVVAKDDVRFPRILDAIRANKLGEIPEIVDATLQFKKAGIEVEEGLLKVRGEVMPTELNAKIMEYRSQKLPFQSLVNFWTNLQLNPSFNSRQQLFKFLENKGHSITEDGCFIGYRGVTTDFKDIHTKTFDNKPGSVCEMPRSMVDDNPANTCSHGFHIAAYQYAKDFAKDGKLVIVKVNPKDVVAVPNDYNGQKMRVCRFEVLSEAEAILQETVVTTKGKKIEAIMDREGEDFAGDTVGDQIDERTEARRTIRARPKSSYKNNHAKRGKDGKFIAKKKGKGKR